jgi:hypothetical protein
MADRTNATNARCDLRHLEVQTSFAEFFEAAKLVDMHVCASNGMIVFHVNGHFGVTFDAGDRFDRNFLSSH